MQSAIERRQQVLEAISDRRTERIENLASEFGVSRRTIERDILVLSCSYPIVTVQGAAGGVRAMDGWYVTRRYLNDDQEALLRSLLPGLQPDQQETMQRKPIIRDTTHSIWRRIKLMPFENTFTEANRDKHFADKIMAKEMPGILAWAVKGCLLWQREGIQDPPSVKRATTEYRTEMDSFATFFEECCEAREGVRVSNKMLRSSYDEWCKDNGEYALSQRPFSQKLLEMGFEKKRSASTGAVEWIGLSIRGVASRL